MNNSNATVALFVIALGLSMDAFAVSLSLGLKNKHLKIIDSIKPPITFALFQTIMPILGWIIGAGFNHLIAIFDHWIAFGLLMFVGIKMIIESKDNEDRLQSKNLKVMYLLTLGLITSIDAFSIGISLGLLNLPLLESVFIIGLVTLVLSSLGIFLGKRVGNAMQNVAGVFGGLVLIAIAIKIVIGRFL